MGDNMKITILLDDTRICPMDLGGTNISTNPEFIEMLDRDAQLRQRLFEVGTCRKVANEPCGKTADEELAYGHIAWEVEYEDIKQELDIAYHQQSGVKVFVVEDGLGKSASARRWTRIGFAGWDLAHDKESVKRMETCRRCGEAPAQPMNGFSIFRRQSPFLCSRCASLGGSGKGGICRTCRGVHPTDAPPEGQNPSL